MSFPYKNPLNAQLSIGPYTVSRTSVQGTDHSVLGIGGWMEVGNLSDLSLTFFGKLGYKIYPQTQYQSIYILVMEHHLTHHTLI